MKHAAALIALGVAVFAGGALVAGSGALSSDPSNRGAAAPGQSIPAPAPLEHARATLVTTTLKVGGMTCPSCSYIVRRALESIPGVTSAKVSMRAGTAVVTYDPSRCDTSQLVASTARYGYPSAVITP